MSGAVTGDLCPAEGTCMSMQPQMMAAAFCPNKVFDAGIHVLHRWLVLYLMVTFICGYLIVQPGQNMGYLSTAMGLGWSLVCHGLLACLLPSAAHGPTTEALAVCLHLLFFVAFPSPSVSDLLLPSSGVNCLGAYLTRLELNHGQVNCSLFYC